MQPFHNICAVDLGSWTIKLSALTHTHRFEILTNQANFRETPTMVSYTQAERLFGDQAVVKVKSNYRNTIRAPQRLIGLGQRQYIMEQQLKYSTLQYRVQNQQLLISIELGNAKLQLQPEHIVVALMTKIQQIFALHSIEPTILYLTVQSYLTNGQRKAIRSCAEAAGFKNTGLVDQWEALVAEYYYLRQHEVEVLTEDIIIIFVDAGYTNFTAHACLFSRSRISLLDQQYLRYIGAKNIDNLLTDFYVELVQKQSGIDIRTNPKAIVKLQQAVENQRKKLSAGTEISLTIECLVGDYDLNYTMSRDQLENICMPVLADFASALLNLRSRVQPVAPIHSIQIVGGLCRMPFLQEVIRNMFNLEASKKMNASQSISRGCAIAAAARMGLLKSKISFVKTIRFPLVAYVHLVEKDGRNYGKNESLYTGCEQKIIFDKNSILPGNTIIKIDGEGTNEIILLSHNNFNKVVVGYLKFKGPDNLTVLIDSDGIIRARLMKQNNFIDYDFGDVISVEKTLHLKQNQDKMKKRDYNILHSYQIKNQFQSLLYTTKQDINTKWKQYCPAEEASTILQIVQEGETWLGNAEEQHSVQNFKSRIETIGMFVEILQNRKNNGDKLRELKKTFIQHVHTVKKLHVEPETQSKIGEIETQFVDLYNKQASGYWEGQNLTLQQAQQLLKALDKLK